MIDNRYDEHPEFDSSVFKEDYVMGDRFELMGHLFTYLGFGTLVTGSSELFDIKVFFASSPGFFEQTVGLPVSKLDNAKINVIHRSLQEDYPHCEFEWTDRLDEDFFLVPLAGSYIANDGSHCYTPEVPLTSRNWVEVDSDAHVTRLGGYPSFGESRDYGQVHGLNANGEYKPLPFIAQMVLPDGRFVHIYHVDDPEGIGSDEVQAEEQEKLGFLIESETRSLVLVEGGEVPEGYKLLPASEEGHYVASPEALTVENGNWPLFIEWGQGSDADDEHPYALLHLPGQIGYGKDSEKMLTYTDAYVVWDGKGAGKLVEQYD